ncbi:glycosyltransferase family 2 protein [Parabacteroides sp. FAFU027]|uniref:glycosyltransferase family 2 protein n=1 Tax=Parabacteroides sp. FAFU027 TaxID=2922715 RepID=UPI001FAF43FD|nr:glycosyl transferase [Parabacteroides sp. FAFU027]
MYAPVILFVYNRLNETKCTVESLLRNKLAKHTQLYIFSDAAKVAEEIIVVDEVRRFVSSIEGFEQVHIHYAIQNKGLARSIIEGTNEVILLHEKAIVMEDDLVVASDFLDYMNQCLEMYAYRKNIWSIAGYSPPIEIPTFYPHDVFLFGRASSHGWATWLDRWCKVDWQVKDFETFSSNRKDRIAFDMTGNDMYRLLELQQMGRMNSWAIRFCYSQFRNNAFTVYPVKSKVQIKGYSAQATHNGLADRRHFVELFEGELYPEVDVSVDTVIWNRFRKHQDLRPIGKIGFFLCKYNLGYKQIKIILKKLFGQ